MEGRLLKLKIIAAQFRYEICAYNAKLLCVHVLVLPFTYLPLGVRGARRYEPHHEKTCLCHMCITKAQISLRISTV